MLSLQYRLLFIHLTEDACCLRADRGLTALSPPGAQTPTPLAGLLRVMTTQKYFTLGAGSAFDGSVNSSRGSNAMSFRPCSPHTPSFLTLLVVSANRVVEHYWKHRGGFVDCQHEMRLLFSTIPPSQWGPPKPSLRSDVFSPLFVCFDDCSLTISVWRSTRVICLRKIVRKQEAQPTRRHRFKVSNIYFKN